MQPSRPAPIGSMGATTSGGVSKLIDDLVYRVFTLRFELLLCFLVVFLVLVFRNIFPDKASLAACDQISRARTLPKVHEFIRSGDPSPNSKPCNLRALLANPPKLWGNRDNTGNIATRAATKAETTASTTTTTTTTMSTPALRPHSEGPQCHTPPLGGTS